MEKFEEVILKESLHQIEILKERISNVSEGKIKTLNACEDYLSEAHMQLHAFLYKPRAEGEDE